MSGARRVWILASANRQKAAEILAILRATDLPIDWRTLADYPSLPPIDETADTFEANAVLKAETARSLVGLPAIADDGGLSVDALNGAPGVHSHRYLGEATPMPAKIAEILRLMEGRPEAERSCRFTCVVAIAVPGRNTVCCAGHLAGTIATEPRGVNGFGFDPIFQLPDGRCMAELAPAEKNRISHRSNALRATAEILSKIVQDSDAGVRQQ
ncbi:MAG: RdgB/HAM1 family non-canonical purine NTP pyrophosphatase [Armatimonadetes bacterium]|nr:RdgB/HAM1 family non-canonical purine NTP pyrophosphatase [Armatimonadota bacterium]MDE2207069.1 RdgB/HAM1 family non-canonical purine NTP pyrophosphatase [Armatimonadota bacterium]